MSVLSVITLGRFLALYDENPLAGLRTIRTQALLIYLATEPEPQTRENLMTLLWPGMPERSARHNLRQSIYHLRSALPGLPLRDAATGDVEPEIVPFLLTNRQTMQLNPDADVEVDVRQFERIIKRTQNHTHVDLLTCHKCLQDLEKAVAIYVGDFLTNFYLEDSNEFENWAQMKRDAYRRKALDSLEILTTIRTRQKAFSDARTFAERQLQIDNLRESAYRQMMEIQALSGQRSEALALYESCRRLLAEELGMEPATRTTEVYNKILAGDLAFDVPLVQGVRGYDLREEIGEGAYGSIHRAVQPAIGREVAVKVIRRKYANDAEFIRRFESEAQTIARLEHPYIVPLYDYWRDPDGAYLVMRFLRGGNLLTSLEAGPWDPESAVKMLDQVASALSAAHHQGVIHRDIKPANILLDEAGNTYLSDFGIAKSLTGEMQLTATGAILGTPDYISPEQIKSEPVGPEADIYSLGAVLYETLTGEKPYPDSTVANLIYKHLNEPMPLVSTSRPDLPPQIDTVIQRATAKHPVDRYSEALEMAEAFKQAVQGMDVTHPVIVPAIIPAGVEIVNPYKGLRPFQEADAEDFFGREALVEQLVGRMTPSKNGRTRDNRFLAVVGPSGSGKSSVVKAGLIPALREGAITGSEKWFVAEMVPGTHPLEELELALWSVAVDPPPSLVEPMKRDIRGMLRTIRRVLPDAEDAQLLLVIDQFEELFTLVDDEERRVFFLDSLLSAISAPRSPLRVVITLRADFYDRPLQIQPLADWIKNNTEIALPLTPEELTWAVREPARRVGVGLEEGLSEAIVADVADQPGALPMLQYTLTELLEARQGNMMTRTAYEEIGGVMGALGSRAEDIYGGLNEAEQEATRQLFLRLVTLGEGVEDTRRRVLRAELEGLSKDEGRWTEDERTRSQHDAIQGQSLIPNPQSPVPSIIDAFGHARLLTFDRDLVTRGPTVEVAHEALLREWRRLRRWLDESRADVRLQRILALAAAEWAGANQDPGFLLRDSRLDQFAGWVVTSTVALTQDESVFLASSIAAKEARKTEEEVRRQRELDTARQLAETEKARAEEQTKSAGRLRRRAVYLGIALVVAVVLTIVAVLFARQSNDNASLAEEREIVALSEAGQRATAQAQAVVEKHRADSERDSAIDAQATAEAERQRANTERDTAQSEAVLRATAESVAIEERVVAEEQSKLAFSRELAAAALDAQAEDQELAVLLAIQALERAHTQEAEDALHRTVQELRLVHTLEAPGKSAFVDLSPDGRRLVSSADAGAAVWDTSTWEILYSIDIEEGWINHADFSPDGKYLVTPNEGSESFVESTVTIYEAETGEELLTFVAHDGWVQDVSFNSDGSLFASAGGDGIAKVWDLAATLAAGEGQEYLVLPPDEAMQWMVKFSPDDSLLVTANDSIIRVWDVDTVQELWSAPSDGGDVAFTPDGRRLFNSTVIGMLDVYDTFTGQRLSRTPAHSNSLQSIRFSPDGTRLASTGNDSTVKVWSFSDDVLSPELTLTGHIERTSDVAFSPDGEQLVSASYVDGTVRIWDISPDGGVEPIFYPHGAGITSLAISPDGSQLATTGFLGTTRIWDTSTGDELHTLPNDDWIWKVAYSPEGNLLATVDSEALVKLWDAENGEERSVISGLPQQDEGWFIRGVMSVAFSPDGLWLTTAGGDGAIRVWEVDSLVEENQSIGDELLLLFEPEEHDWSYDVSYSSNGRWIAASVNTYDNDYGNWGSGDGRVIVWDAESSQIAWSLEGQEGSIFSNVAFSPDGTYIAAGHFETGDATVWRLPDDPSGVPTELFTIQASKDFVSSLHFSPDGSQLAVPHSDGMGIWDAGTGEFIQSLPHPSMTLEALYTPDGKYVLTAGFDGYGRLFILDTDELIDLAESRLMRSLSTEECHKYLRMEACPIRE